MQPLRVIAVVASFCLTSLNAAPLQTWVYVPWWLPQSWKTVAMDHVDRIFLFHFEIHGDGSLEIPEGWPGQWQELLAQAQTRATPVELTLTLLDPDKLHRLLASPANQTRFLDQATTLAATPRISGLHLDFEVFERLPGPERDAFQALVIALQRRLSLLETPRHLSAFIPSDANGPLYLPRSLAVLDACVVQAYDAHWQTSDQAGPVAPLTGPDNDSWESILRRVQQWGIPREKMVFSFPLYGYEWTVQHRGYRATTLGEGKITSDVPLSPEDVPEIQIDVQQRTARYGRHYDPQSGSAYYDFRDGAGIWHVGWFEDEHTLDQKLRFLERERLAGLAFFPLGYDDGQLVRYYIEHVFNTGHTP